MLRAHCRWVLHLPLGCKILIEILENTLLQTLKGSASLGSRRLQNGDVQSLRFSVMDKLHKPLVAASKVVAGGSRIVLQPEDRGGSYLQDVRSKRRKRSFERNGVFVLPCWVVKWNSQKRLPLDESRPNDRQVYPVSPVTSTEESCPVHADGSGPVRADAVRADGFTDEEKVQKAEELRHVPAPALPSEGEVEAHNVSHLPFRSWWSACVNWTSLPRHSLPCWQSLLQNL